MSTPGEGGGPIVTTNAHRIDIETLDPEQRAQLRQTLLILRAQRDEREEE
jgi:hypothetical protein